MLYKEAGVGGKGLSDWRDIRGKGERGEGGIHLMEGG